MTLMDHYQPSEDAKMIEGYKAEWKKHGFPDVDLAVNSRVHAGNLNDPRSQPSPEQQLWSAVLRENIADLRRYDPRKRPIILKHKRESAVAKAWIDSYDHNIGSFEWVCSVLGLDSAYVRKNIDYVKPGRSHVIAINHGRKPLQHG